QRLRVREKELGVALRAGHPRQRRAGRQRGPVADQDRRAAGAVDPPHRQQPGGAIVPDDHPALDEPEREDPNDVGDAHELEAGGRRDQAAARKQLELPRDEVPQVEEAGTIGAQRAGRAIEGLAPHERKSWHQGTGMVKRASLTRMKSIIGSLGLPVALWPINRTKRYEKSQARDSEFTSRHPKASLLIQMRQSFDAARCR